MDFKAATAKLPRPVLSKMAHIQRVRRVLKTKKAQTVVKNIALRIEAACRLVVTARGQAIKGSRAEAARV